MQLVSRAWGQRASENVVTSAEDAFGTSVGYASIGLYTPSDARGFSPRQAGNLRIEGLYFDYEGYGDIIDPCLVRESQMRIGIAAQTYSFPSPTGIADFKLNVPSGESTASAVGYRGPYGGSGVILEVQAPLSKSVSFDLCGAYNGDFLPDIARGSHNSSVGSVWRWRPTDRIEILPFLDLAAGGARGLLPWVYTDGLEPPPLFAEMNLASQSFTTWDWHQSTLGAVIRQSFGKDWSLSAGLFRYHEHDPLSFTEEYLSILPNRSADHELDVVPPLNTTATSGEVRISRQIANARQRHKLEFALRGRRVDRTFGGDTLIDYGTVYLQSPPPAPLSGFRTGSSNVDKTRELDFGAAYEDRVDGLGSFAIGVLKDEYRRTIQAPDSASLGSTKTPWLFNTRLTMDAPASIVYASFTQGLEDSELAPYTAVNRGEPPIASRTHQVDAGVRYAPTHALTLIVGGFDIKKVYFNLDAANVYTALGTVRHRGLESSLTYAEGGLTIVTGGVWLRPHVERTIPEPGATGSVPIGPVPLTLKLNVDYAPPSWSPWSTTLEWNRISRRVATADDRYELPVLSTLDAGLRYSSKLDGHPFSLRLDGKNLTNSRGLHLTPVEQVIPELGRRYQLTLAIDI